MYYIWGKGRTNPFAADKAMRPFAKIIWPYVLFAVDWRQSSCIRAGLAEYCQWEQLEITCQPDEVIVISGAYYGRMQYGRCIRRDYGYVGCYADVRALADSRCSGRRSCRISVPDMLFDGTTPCPEDLKLYLMAGYTCVKGTCGACAPSFRIHIVHTVHKVSINTAGVTLASGLQNVKQAKTRCSRRRQASPSVQPAGGTGRNIRVVFDLVSCTALSENMTSSTKPEVYIVLPSEEDRATAKCNKYREFGEIWTCGFWDMRGQMQTDRQTDRLIAILWPLTGTK